METVRDEKLYGCNHFLVEKANFPPHMSTFPDELVLSFHSDGVYVLTRDRVRPHPHHAATSNKHRLCVSNDLCSPQPQRAAAPHQQNILMSVLFVDVKRWGGSATRFTLVVCDTDGDSHDITV